MCSCENGSNVVATLNILFHNVGTMLKQHHSLSGWQHSHTVQATLCEESGKVENYVILVVSECCVEVVFWLAHIIYTMFRPCSYNIMATLKITWFYNAATTLQQHCLNTVWTLWSNIVCDIISTLGQPHNTNVFSIAATLLQCYANILTTLLQRCDITFVIDVVATS